MTDWPRSPITGRVVLGATIGRTTFSETVERTKARQADLVELHRQVAGLLVGQLDRLAAGTPAEVALAALICSVDHLAGRPERTFDAA